MRTSSARIIGLSAKEEEEEQEEEDRVDAARGHMIVREGKPGATVTFESLRGSLSAPHRLELMVVVGLNGVLSEGKVCEGTIGGAVTFESLRGPFSQELSQPELARLVVAARSP